MAVGPEIARLHHHREAENHRVGRFEVVGIALDAYERAHARAELVRVERLADEVVCARVNAADAIARVSQRGHEHDRNQPRASM